MTAILWLILGAGLVLAVLLLRRRLWSFEAQRPADYAAAPGARFDLRRHLNGPLLCEGVIYGPRGRVTSRFVARFEAEWQGSSGRMTEDFTYDSGSTQQREWRLELSEDGRIAATAPDLVGPASGRQAGAAVQLRYRIRLPKASGGHVLSATDWMYLAPNGTIVNRSQFRKFGFKVAELVATIRPEQDEAA